MFGYIAALLLGLVFLVMGLTTLGQAYSQPTPQNMVMIIFAASFMILVGLAILVGFIARLRSKLLGREDDEK